MTSAKFRHFSYSFILVAIITFLLILTIFTANSTDTNFEELEFNIPFFNLIEAFNAPELMFIVFVALFLVSAVLIKRYFKMEHLNLLILLQYLIFYFLVSFIIVLPIISIFTLIFPTIWSITLALTIFFLTFPFVVLLAFNSTIEHINIWNSLIKNPLLTVAAIFLTILLSFFMVALFAAFQFKLAWLSFLLLLLVHFFWIFDVAQYEIDNCELPFHDNNVALSSITAFKLIFTLGLFYCSSPYVLKIVNFILYDDYIYVGILDVFFKVIMPIIALFLILFMLLFKANKSVDNLMLTTITLLAGTMVFGNFALIADVIETQIYSVDIVFSLIIITFISLLLAFSFIRLIYGSDKSEIPPLMIPLLILVMILISPHLLFIWSLLYMTINYIIGRYNYVLVGVVLAFILVLYDTLITVSPNHIVIKVLTLLFTITYIFFGFTTEKNNSKFVNIFKKRSYK